MSDSPIFDYLVKMHGEERMSAMLGAIEERQAIGATRDCPDCGRPQHYTGLEYGWAHDAAVDMWDCAGDRVRANKTTEAGA